MDTVANTDRGIKNIKKYKRHGGVGGRFEKEQSIPAKAERNRSSKLEKFSKAERYAKIAGQVAMGNYKHAAEKAAVAAASDFVINQTNKRMTKKRKAKLTNLPKEKMTGSAFYAMVALVLAKDALDIIVGFTVFLSPLSVPFGIIVGLVLLSYFVANQVKFSTRKAVSTALTLIIEIIPLVASVLPLATINLFLIKYFEKSERIQKIAKSFSSRRSV